MFCQRGSDFRQHAAGGSADIRESEIVGDSELDFGDEDYKLNVLDDRVGYIRATRDHRFE